MQKLRLQYERFEKWTMLTTPSSELLWHSNCWTASKSASLRINSSELFWCIGKSRLFIKHTREYLTEKYKYKWINKHPLSHQSNRICVHIRIYAKMLWYAFWSTSTQTHYSEHNIFRGAYLPLYDALAVLIFPAELCLFVCLQMNRKTKILPHNQSVVW